MYKNIKSFIKKQWLLMWIAVVGVLLTAMSVSAEYGLTTNVMNRVVRSVSAQGMMFSSNYLVENGSQTYIAKYVSEVNPFDIDVYLWNYSMDNISKWYPESIEYKITVELVDSKGNALNLEESDGRSVKILDSNGTEMVTLNKTTLMYTSNVQTLNYSESKSDENRFIIRYPSDWDLNDTDFCVRVTASPYRNGNNNKYKDLKDISAILGLKESLSTGSKGWRAYINEESTKQITDCDAYNVVVTGSGKATIRLTWNTRYLDFNEYFYNGSKSIYTFGTGEVSFSTSGNQATITINADTGSSLTSHRNRYDIQLYKTGTSEPVSWNQLKQWLTIDVSTES